MRDQLIQDILSRKSPNECLTEALLKTWTTKRLRSKIKNLDTLDEKEKILESLRKYGDTASNTNMFLSTLQKNLNYVQNEGSTKNAKKRGELIRKINCYTKSVSYQDLMTENIKQLELRLTYFERLHKKRELIEKLNELGYKKTYLKNLSVEELDHIANDPAPYSKSNRQEMMETLLEKYSWKKATLVSWNTDKLKSAFKKDLQQNYSPLAEAMPKRTTEEERENFEYPRRNKKRSEYLTDLANTLYYDIVN